MNNKIDLADNISHTIMKVKYYYYVVAITQGNSVIYIKGTLNTIKDDFPLRGVQDYIVEHYKKSIKNIAIIFYKEITEDNYKTYNNEQ